MRTYHCRTCGEDHKVRTWCVKHLRKIDHPLGDTPSETLALHYRVKEKYRQERAAKQREEP